MFDYQRVHGLEIKLARIFDTYGPRMLANDGRVISNFIVQALRDEPITVYGTGEQTRSFCFVDDPVRGLNMLMHPEEISVEAIAREIIACTGSKSALEFRPLPQDDPKRRKPVIDAAEKRLGWRPRIPLKKGMEATIAYFALQVASVAPATVVGLPGHGTSAATGASVIPARKR
jgi:UDP-glucuronate decarboxylase